MRLHRLLWAGLKQTCRVTLLPNVTSSRIVRLWWKKIQKKVNWNGISKNSVGDSYNGRFLLFLNCSGNKKKDWRRKSKNRSDRHTDKTRPTDSANTSLSVCAKLTKKIQAVFTKYSGPRERCHFSTKQEKQKEQDCIPVGCVPPACWPYLPSCTAQGGACSGGVSAPGGGACSQGEACLLQRGVCSWGRGGLLPWGGLLWGYPNMRWGRPPCEQNDRQVKKYYLAPNFVCGR